MPPNSNVSPSIEILELSNALLGIDISEAPEPLNEVAVTTPVTLIPSALIVTPDPITVEVNSGVSIVEIVVPPILKLEPI